MVHILTNEASLTGGDRMFEIWQLRAYHPNCHVYWDWSDGQTWCPNIPMSQNHIVHWSASNWIKVDDYQQVYCPEMDADMLCQQTQTHK